MIERRVKRQLSKGWRFHTSEFDLISQPLMITFAMLKTLLSE